MSGPIIRKYGFPNFEKIFGERAIEHGVDDASKQPGKKTRSSPAGAKKSAKAKKKASAKKKK